MFDTISTLVLTTFTTTTAIIILLNGHIVNADLTSLHPISQTQRPRAVPRLHIESVLDASSVSDSHEEAVVRQHSKISVTAAATVGGGADPTPASTISPACQYCPPGTFANTSEGNNCTIWDKHHLCADVVGSCIYPEYTPGAQAKTYCQHCGPGLVTNNSRSTSCHLCPRGSSGDDKGISCSPCPRGEYTPGDSPLCTHCPAGQQPAPTRASCDQCDRGQFSNADTGYLCAICRPPNFVPANRTCCEPCDPGYQALDGDRCLPCSSGQKWTVAAGCTACPPGTHCVKIPSPVDPSKKYCASCEQCAKGSYSIGEQDTCTLCPPGRFEDQTGSSRPCEGCKPGTYQLDQGKSSCINCPEGSFCPNASSVLPCPSDKFCPPGSVAPLECSSLYEPDNTGCRASVELIAIIAATSAVGFLVFLVIGYLCYLKYENSRRGGGSSKTLLRPARDPVYGGL